jgi:hypothetical protein
MGPQSADRSDPNGGVKLRQLMLGAALGAAFGLPLCVETASAKAGDPASQRSVCRLAAAARPLKPLLAVNSPAERISRRAIYTPMPSGATAREQAPYLALLERQSKPASLIVGVGF